MPKYRIAELIAEYEPLYERLRRQSEKYRVPDDAQPDFRLRFVADFYERKAVENPLMNDEEQEYFYIGQLFYLHLLEHNGCMLHASAVAVDNRAYLFSAPCGTGKSTHTAQWRALLGDRAVIINDDKPAIRKMDGGYYAYGTPFSGKTDLNVNVKVPLGAICILERGAQNEIRRMDAKRAIMFFLEQTTRSRLAGRMDALLTFLNDLFLEVPIYKMKCTASVDAAKMAYEAMRGANNGL